MEKKKVIFSIVKILLALLVFVGMFFISIPTGIAAIVFSIFGVFIGFNCRQAKIYNKFFDALLENKESILAGKLVTITSEDDSVSVLVTEVPKKKTVKTKEKVEETK